jgi:uncharacterized membrane protein
MIKNIQRGEALTVNIVSTVLSYFVLVFTLMYVVIPYALQKKETNISLSASYLALTTGALIGFSIYGVFNTTNVALFKNYSGVLALIDTLWGSFLFFITTYVYIRMLT